MKLDNSRKFAFAAAVGVCCLFAGAKAPENQVLVTNSVANTVTLFVFDYDQSKWRQPAMKVHRGATSYLPFPQNRAVYLVARDSESRDFHIGQFNFSELLQQFPDGKLDLTSCTTCSAGEDIETYEVVVRRRGKLHRYTVTRTTPRPPPPPSIIGIWSSGKSAVP